MALFLSPINKVVKAELKRRIEEAASNRDAASPLSVSDVYSENNGFLWGFGPLG